MLSKCVNLLLESARLNFNVYHACLSMIGSKQFVGKNQVNIYRTVSPSDGMDTAVILQQGKDRTRERIMIQRPLD